MKIFVGIALGMLMALVPPSGVTQLSKVSEHLHMAADTGDAELLEADLKRIDRALRLISAQYSEGSLPHGAPSAAGHAGGRKHE